MIASDVFLPDDSATRKLGSALGAILKPGDVVCLSGPLGAGKTTLARGAIERLAGVLEAPSPTFPLVETYAAEGFELWHFDLYRLVRPEDAFELGIEDAFAAGASIIEWPERIGGLIPDEALIVRLSLEAAGRRATFEAEAAWRSRLAAAGIMQQA